jgi:hypothetical protein
LSPKGPKTQGKNEASAAQGKTPGPPFLPGQRSGIAQIDKTGLNDVFLTGSIWRQNYHRVAFLFEGNITNQRQKNLTYPILSNQSASGGLNRTAAEHSLCS